MKQDLKNKEWAEFVIGKLFNIVSTSSGIDKNKLINKFGNIPYITRTEQNNGYDSFIGTQETSYKIDDRNVITIGLDTQTVFYQTTPFYTGQNIQIIGFNKLNNKIAKFLIPLFKKQMVKFNWGGNGATLTRLKKAKILLPINDNKEPDYSFMEEYINELERRKQDEYFNHIQQHFDKLKNVFQPESFKNKKWKGFFIGDLFILKQGKSKGLNHLNKVNSGGINYLGATNQNNGVLAYVNEQTGLIQKGNAICFIRNGEGSMGYSIYKSEDFISTSDISVGYASFLNRYTGLFITTVADKVRGKYNFGYKRSDLRLKKEKIMLPIKSDETPDYQYMENYMKYLEYQKLKEYLEFKKDRNN